MGSLISVLFMILWGGPPLSLSLGRVFGVWRCHGEGFFCWTVAWGKILTCDNLRRRWYTIMDWFCTCRCSREGVDHLLIHCTEADQLCCFVFKSFRISWVLLVCERSIVWLDKRFGNHSLVFWNLLYKEESEVASQIVQFYQTLYQETKV